MKRIRIATLLCPPAGLWLLWQNRDLSLGRRFLGTLGTLLYSLLYAAGVVLLLMQFTPLQIEWRGGFPPVLTFRKTNPDYQAVEAHRRRQAEGKVAVTTFTVTPEGAGETSNVTIATELPVRSGMLGAIERFLTTKALQPLYREELRKLAAFVSTSVS